MNLEKNSCQVESKQWHDECNRLLYYHVVLSLKDGSTVDGIIGRVDEDQVIVLVGEDVIEDESRFVRPLGGGGGRFRRFGPRGFPFASIAAISLLAYPFFFPPYPYYYPYPYPYYPYY
ncbi:hypothetical protein [Turicibacter sanguinis]|uniref:hypothetical protein n=1 Tax=Turicibacter sanguinis TaxID=154288 RepID=UPI0018A98D23|nr:hypothetical protein [Turicibacter sanguinis]MDB8551355.1 hypothetical protein [Turicibacter sanguinis]